MIDQNPKLSKSDTKLLLRYATAHDQAQNIAQLIGVAPARISEGKKGEWQLPKDSAEKIYQDYGRPQAAPGIYLYAEVWTSLQEVIETTEQILLLRQWQRVDEALKSHQMRDLVEKCILPSGDQHDIPLKDLHGRLLSLVEDPLFKEWYLENRHFEIERDYSDIRSAGSERDGLFFKTDRAVTAYGNGHNELLGKHGLYFPAGRMFMDATDVWIFVLFLCELSIVDRERFSVDSNGLGVDLRNVVSDEIVSRSKQLECVVVGESVWKKSSWLKTELIHKNPDFFNNLGDVSSRYSREAKGCDKFLDIFPEKFNRVSLDLIINKDLEYHLVVELSLKRNFESFKFMKEHEVSGFVNESELYRIRERKIIIKNIASDVLVDTVVELADWLNVDDIDLSSLKTEIVLNGGFVPGALYL